MFDMLGEVLRSSPDWTELRFHKRITTSVSVEKGEVRSAKVDTYSGVGVRVLVDGAWGFSATSEVTVPAVKKAVEEARSIARFMAKVKKEKVKLAPVKGASGEFALFTADPVTNHTIEEKLALAISAERDTRSRSPLIVHAAASYLEYVDEKFIVNSDGSRARVLDAKPQFTIRAVAAKDGELSTAYKAIGVTGGWKDLFTKDNPEHMAEYAATLAVDKLTAPHADGGVFTVVMDPDIVGLLSHEAIGHTVESDFVLSGSAASGKIGQKVASELVTLCDSGLSELKPFAAGIVPVDDEGTPVGRTVIIENGILKSYLHNRETAAHFGIKPTGNARAWEYDNEPIIRMRNTYIEPGRSSVEEMIAGVKDGYYLKGGGGGQADANAEFMFSVLEARRIKNGKLGALVREATISGQAFNVLSSVDAVGDNFEWAMGSGHCGKGQPAKVDGGGPALRAKATVGGKQGR